jgi:uncharacterized protein (TIGR02271 family)
VSREPSPRELDEAKRDRARVVDPDGTYLGDLEAIYYADVTGTPTWLGVRTGFVPSRRVLLPVAGTALESDGSLRVPHGKDEVEASPEVDGDRIDRDMESGLYDHYGVEPPPTPPELVRHEERLDVLKPVEQIGVVRVRKQVEAEQAEGEFPREIEAAELERMPVEGEDSGLVETLPDGSVSIPVFEEELVVTKRVVVRERVIVRKQTTVEQQTVAAELRRERVEIDADPGIDVEDE